MKISIVLFALLLVISLLVTGCTLPARGTPPPPTATASPDISAPRTSPDAGTVPTVGPTDTGILPSLTPLPAVTETSVVPVVPAVSTDTPLPPTAPAMPPTSTPLSPPPTSTPLSPRPSGPFDPVMVYGEPDFEDPMNGSQVSDWWNENLVLPNTNYIRMTVDSSRFYVTGKLAGFSTWYFTWRELSDFYLETTFDSASCSGQDAYGLIIRGPEHRAGVSYGYVVAFTCDGQLWVFRLDGANPYTAEDLVSLIPSQRILTGQNQQNTMGIQAVGDTLTIYANGYQIAQVVDDTYEFGRFGLFVSPQWTTNFTYRVVHLSLWDLED